MDQSDPLSIVLLQDDVWDSLTSDERRTWHLVSRMWRDGCVQHLRRVTALDLTTATVDRLSDECAQKIVRYMPNLTHLNAGSIQPANNFYSLVGGGGSRITSLVNVRLRSRADADVVAIASMAATLRELKFTPWEYARAWDMPVVDLSPVKALVELKSLSLPYCDTHDVCGENDMNLDRPECDWLQALSHLEQLDCGMALRPGNVAMLQTLTLTHLSVECIDGPWLPRGNGDYRYCMPCLKGLRIKGGVYDADALSMLQHVDMPSLETFECGFYVIMDLDSDEDEDEDEEDAVRTMIDVMMTVGIPTDVKIAFAPDWFVPALASRAAEEGLTNEISELD